MCKNGNERFISITALIKLLFMVMSFLLFLCGVDVTISDVSLTHKSKFWLDCPKSSCMVSMGIHLLQASHSTQLTDKKGNESWSVLPQKLRTLDSN